MTCYARTALAVAAALLLAACAGGPARVETVEVKVPVPVRAEPPDELLETVPAPTVRPFVDLDDPAAVAGITEPGLRSVGEHVDDLRSRLRAWRAWATDDEEDGDDAG